MKCQKEIDLLRAFPVLIGHLVALLHAFVGGGGAVLKSAKSNLSDCTDTQL